MELYRSHYSKDVNTKNHGKIITVAGWIEDVRNIGSLAFIILRDKIGTLQVTVFKKDNLELWIQFSWQHRSCIPLFDLD